MSNDGDKIANDGETIVSFGVDEGSFEALRTVSKEEGVGSPLPFQRLVEKLIYWDGRVEFGPARAIVDEESGPLDELPPRVTVCRSYIREKEELELAAEHLAQELEETKREARQLESRLERVERNDTIELETLDEGAQRMTVEH